jgi:hypothetical protein
MIAENKARTQQKIEAYQQNNWPLQHPGARRPHSMAPRRIGRIVGSLAKVFPWKDPRQQRRWMATLLYYEIL